MRLSNKQAIMLVQLLRDTLTIKDEKPAIFTFVYNQRAQMYNEILSAQTDELVELDQADVEHE